VRLVQARAAPRKVHDLRADFIEVGRIRLALDGAGHAILVVSNKGPLLPEAVHGKLFEAMVSVRSEHAREGGSAEPHLGLGLYVARLIAEFHGGTIAAENLSAGDGVAVSATFRLG